jgi:predicted TIM-barrel fold metal-dependent hydrolase
VIQEELTRIQEGQPPDPGKITFRAPRVNGVWKALLAFPLALAVAATVHGQPEPTGKGRIVDVNEHLESLSDVPKLLAAMKSAGIRKTVLLGSPSFTFTLDPRTGFAGYAANNEMLLQAAAQHPDSLEAWPTIDPEDPNKLEKLEGYIEKGATGVMLYLGHGYRQKGAPGYFFHKMAMDDPRMLPVYEYVQGKNIPVMFHVNPGPTKPGFAEEFVSVLKRFPDMKVIAPHFILSSIKDTRLREFLDTFPNLYSDISFGQDPYLTAGLARISSNPQKFRQLFEDYPDRFMFGTGVGVTSSKLRTEGWLADRFRAYVDMLSKKDYQAVIGRSLHFVGLELPIDVRQHILYENFAAFMAKRPSGTRITREIDWKRMGIEPSGRQVAKKVSGPEGKPLEGWAVLKREALEATDPKVRSKAIENLGRENDETRAAAILAEVLKKEPVPEVRDDALSAIEFFEPVPKDPVLDRLTSDPEPEIRLHAMEIVEDEEWQGKEIEEVLVKATDDANDEVRRQAVELLAEVEAWDALEKLAKGHKSEEIRRLAAQQLEDR